MLKSFAKFLGLLTLALSVITMVLDLTRSIANSELTITPLGREWFDFSASSLNFSQAIVQRYLHPFLWDPIIIAVLKAPSWFVFAILAIIFLWLGSRREKGWQKRFGS